MTLEAAFRHSIGSLRLEVELVLRPGETVALVGPNGAGKTTLLRALAGLVPVDEGRLLVDGDVWDDTSRSVRRPSSARSLGFVFQDYLLFPHLSALENVAFGLRARGVPRGEARARALEWLDRVGVGAYASAKPGALSGGQAQRVALARALVTQPRILLLDEPLAALDAGARGELRRELRRHLATFEGYKLVVTHDPVEAVALADRLIVLENGRIAQIGSVEDVAARPRSRYIAEMVGVNLYRGKVAAGAFNVEGGGELAVVTEVEGPAFAVVHPRSIALHRRPPEGTPRNVWRGIADACDLEGDRARVHVAGDLAVVAEVTPQAASELRLLDGGDVWVSIKATEILVYPT